MGRSDDMLIVKGVNVFPSQIETVLMNRGYAANREKELESDLKSMLGIYADVQLVAPKTIARSEGKAVRIIDKRNLY